MEKKKIAGQCQTGSNKGSSPIKSTEQSGKLQIPPNSQIQTEIEHGNSSMQPMFALVQNVKALQAAFREVMQTVMNYLQG